MFVSVDMDKLQFLHKHKEHDILSGLAWLEAPDRSVLIESTDRQHFLGKMTSLNLNILHRNTTGMDVTGSTPLVVREILATIVETQLSAIFVSAAELDAQIAAVESDLYDGIGYKYTLGSRKPAKQDQLFALHGKPLTPEETMQAAARAPQRRSVHKAAPRAASAAKPAQAAPKLARAPAGSVRPKIWAEADRMWEAAGKPMDKQVVLKLRKEMMTVLEEEHGVKRTSSSNELGNWMKDRLG